ncbi:TraX family protein [Bacillus salitolerans]|uniref:TraX family protein n=1 Tax=Bacillus salitolerans TaxID=1437434 RepID=A0ABW4LLV5_9BACI
MLRIIGRLAFPIYCFALTQGYRYTGNMKNYFGRLAFLMVISQIPYVLAFNTWTLNVIYTLFFAVLVLWLIDNTNWYVFLPVGMVLSCASEIGDYGIYGIVLVLLYKYTKGYQLLIGHMALNIISWSVFDWSYIQLFSVLGTIVIMNVDKIRTIKVNRVIYRGFYPIHLFVLFLFKI